MGNLHDDLVRQQVTFVIIDFEATTPAGYPPQPIEVAALALRYTHDGWAESGRSTSLMQPPAFAPVTWANTVQSGLTPEHFTTAPTPAEALGALDRRFTGQSRYLLVAQHAATEANIIHHQREHCPTLARIDLIDTIPLSKHILPGLANYKLDTLLAHLSIANPADRHRATADVEVTARMFTDLINIADRGRAIGGLTELVTIARRTARANLPTQQRLFES